MKYPKETNCDDCKLADCDKCIAERENEDNKNLQSVKEIIKELFRTGVIEFDSAYCGNDCYSSNNPEDVIVKIDNEEICRFKGLLAHSHR